MPPIETLISSLAREGVEARSAPAPGPQLFAPSILRDFPSFRAQAQQAERL